MTKEEFQIAWESKYSGTAPISHLLKLGFQDRWFRIHSLPGSKRYPENETDWETLLKRQNEVLTDLFGISTPIYLVTGDYNLGNQNTNYLADEVLQRYNFNYANIISLYKLDNVEYDEADYYQPAFAEIKWALKKHDLLLRKIASDQTRAIFVSFDKNIIAAPYDGGVDIIVVDTKTKNYFKEKYHQYLSDRDDEF